MNGLSPVCVCNSYFNRPNETAIIDCSSHDILTDVYNSGVQCDSKPVDHFKGNIYKVALTSESLIHSQTQRSGDWNSGGLH